MTVQDAPDSREPASRELKVRVPLSMHVHLHSLRILTGTSISAVVTEALVRYFEGPGAEELSTLEPGSGRRRRPGDE